MKPRPLSIADFRLLRTHVVLVRASMARGIIRCQDADESVQKCLMDGLKK